MVVDVDIGWISRVCGMGLVGTKLVVDFGLQSF